jgi:hypothetical protein
MSRQADGNVKMNVQTMPWRPLVVLVAATAVTSSVGWLVVGELSGKKSCDEGGEFGTWKRGG